MSMMRILAEVPEQLLARVADGSAERVGMIVRDTATKKIIGHLQETGATQEFVGSALKHFGGAAGDFVSGPVSAVTGIGTLIQNEQIKGRLKVLETMMGGMQALQVATLLTSVAGIGVTAASTAVILSRLNRIDTALGRLGDKIDESSANSQDWDIHRILKSVEVHLQRLDEAGMSRTPEPEMRRSEGALRDAFGDLEVATGSVLRRDTVDPVYLSELLAAMSLCGSAQIKVLIWLDEKERAAQRAQSLYKGLRSIALQAPGDSLASKLGNAEAAGRIGLMNSDVRLRLAAIPDMAAVLLEREIHGRDYLDMVEGEKQEPLLMLPAQA